MENANLVPVVLESSGALGAEAYQFMRRISFRVRSGEFADASPRDIERFLVDTLSVSMQRGTPPFCVRVAPYLLCHPRQAVSALA